MRHPLFVWTLVALLAGLSWWLAERPAPPREQATVHADVRRVDYYLRELGVTTMGRDGRPARTLRAAELRHYSDDDTTGVRTLRLTLHSRDAPPWEIRADTGWVSASGDLVLLDGEVHITREGAEGVRPMRIDTRNLRIQPEQGYAETDERVRVRSRRDRLDASGMQAWFHHPARIKFLADVKGYYAPP
ncbi:LPS export ABC transporter periplasmic protein LptC [endosymbiont of unidentified scaly snail isolate Monju]|uniref:LPS export ABC transporter periplasmic protein LptC n=1 Tax=endosymbiont of unidentified scaly snail isolate Monju TaxID=1248727 RepID=UPI0003892380|nr:LPS export ABC transporter periplasmic protein LptC [endosymbiont of unidentified scaly snail isolate Monju]BAN70075.1 lipopolysaccharide export system protein LptC [endosymbiont of unidentified scaly snail isolate Monju]